MTEILDQSDLTDRAAHLVEAAKKAGADSADTVCVRGISLSVDMRHGKVEETRRAEGDDFTLRAFVGRRSATVSANVLADPAELAERAVAMARAAPADEFAGLADPGLLVKSFDGDLDLLDETIPQADELTQAALAAEDAMRAVEGVSNSGGASAGWSLGGMVLATSDGFAGSYLASRFSLSASAIAGTGTAMERDYDYAMRTHRADLADPATIGRKAGERAVRRLNPASFATGGATVVFDPRVASGLFGSLAGATNGAAIARRTSFLREKLGQAIFPANINVTDDPSRKRGLASRLFDGEGVRPQPLDLVKDGVLQAWFLDSASARELGLVTNGHAGRGSGNPSPGPTNLTLAPGDQSPEDLLAAIGEGLYVTEMIGHGANLLTGDYSRGAAGFAIRDGKLAEPVSEITVAGNLGEMFLHLTAASDLEYRFSVNAPTVAVEGMTVAGQ
ncbi:MAG: TldD/PmbA family protein [Bauldia sp.]|uniref:TldD/PmbA family protein n=1 Tax=Bauldia sp. TaxID=2575872 RepID=UPI001D7F8A64|nr:TldD/PmbA family protein [Bauldia sp.]MCB1497767.1 TldD/PmbA family protein [Bauldia sp.]